MLQHLTCLVLVGGKGTRLREIVKDVPKPMALVNNRPFLEYLILRIKKDGVKDFVFCVGYKADLIKKYFDVGTKYAVSIKYSTEKHLLGTAGAIKKAHNLINSDPFLVVNGDSYCKIDLNKLYRQHKQRNVLATISAVRVNDRSRYSSLYIDREGYIRYFCEKENNSGKGYISAGVYMFSSKLLSLIPPNTFVSLERDIFPSLNKKEMSVFITNGPFIDIGTPQSYKQAQLFFKRIKIN